MSARGIPQIAVVMGSCTAGGAYVPAMCDQSIIVREQGTIFLGGPPLVKAATGEVVSAEDLGGADVHARISGVADHYAAGRRARAGDGARYRRHAESRQAARHRAARTVEPRYPIEDLYGIVPTSLRKPFDIREIIARLVDDSEFDEFKQLYGTTLICGFAHLYGIPGRHRRQQRHPVLGVGAEGRAFRRALRQAPDPTDLFAEHHRFHGRAEIRAPRYRARRREDG